jgi:4-carboxymuconolactone decarboxylase
MDPTKEMINDKRKRGEQIRRETMSDAFVDKALNNISDFEKPIQDLVMENAWGTVWDRDGLDRKTRSMITMAMLIGLKAPNELKGHVRGALRNGCTVQEIQEILIHATAYCGFPATLEATRAVKEIIEEHEASQS